VIHPDYVEYAKYVDGKKTNKNLVEDLTRLRNEIVSDAFEGNRVKNAALAIVVYKINSCLGKGYPRR